MFGENPVRKTTYDTDGSLLMVQEVFGTIQGEGPFAGQTAIFIRLAGCNLRCTFCDTDFESAMNDAPWTVAQVLERVGEELDRVCTRLVVLTGGEPLRQNVLPLLQGLIGAGFHVQIETSGSVCDTALVPLFEDVVPEHLSIVCSPKTPRINPVIERYCTHFKYITNTEDISTIDGLPTMTTQREGTGRIYRPTNDKATIWLQPMMVYHHSHVREVDGSVDRECTDANTRACVQVAMQYNYRVSVQLHKLLNLP